MEKLTIFDERFFVVYDIGKIILNYNKIYYYIRYLDE